MKNEKNGILHRCECFKPEIRNSFKDLTCSKEQIIECHGIVFIESIKIGEAFKK